MKWSQGRVSLALLMTTSTVLIEPSLVLAAEKQTGLSQKESLTSQQKKVDQTKNIEKSNSQSIEMEQPDEAFLEFLATMSVVDEEISDPLDMLEIADEQMDDEVDLDEKLNSEESQDKTETKVIPEAKTGSGVLNASRIAAAKEKR
ncbi:hypothetical protein [Aliikangiella coralliicola]|uniref:Uncharacterized protein n=1 Tax=Aliikangiella coralliicola TaxID=2592383 RepID=A0A545U619_9GAMM|nr:hypothetical protein [Aliikangiella coralliicola]TQV84920.1 hypothetical protein FLL46_21225 [Aliikangiella coralliicola]